MPGDLPGCFSLWEYASMMVVGDCIVFDSQENISTIYSQLQSAGFEVKQHYEWCWYAECWAARFYNTKDTILFLLQRGN